MGWKYYTYLWLRPYTCKHCGHEACVSYVGKGCGWRGLKSAGHKISRPKDIKNIIIEYHPTEEEALEVEKFFIDYYGRLDLSRGCLRNRTNGGENPPSQLGIPKSKEHRHKIGESKIGKSRKPFSEEWKQHLREAGFRRKGTATKRNFKQIK